MQLKKKGDQMTDVSFINLCYSAIGLMIQLVNLIVQYWYFALLFAAGLVGVGFDVIAELNDLNDTN